MNTKKRLVIEVSIDKGGVFLYSAIIDSYMKRFFDKVNKTETCWLWTASLRGNTGYGAFKLNGKTVDAHRLSYQLHKGEIPEGMYVCHTCDNRKCVNPDHLFLGTARDNYHDAVKKGRIIKGRKNEELKKHPGRGAYLRGCRCYECKAIHNMNQKKYRDKIKKHDMGDDFREV